MNIENGIFNIDKPEGWTSQDVVAKLRGRLKQYGIKKVGHTGTLDPMATGVLPICFGNATRIIEFYGADLKTYRAGMKLGEITDTLDVTGEVLERRSFSNVTLEKINVAFSSYNGIVEQTPPKYSALKIDGKPLYEYVRNGKDVDIASKKRKIYIDGIKILRTDLNAGEVNFEVRCSKGTYIRTICDDIGRVLGCGACMSSLRRTGSGVFRESEALSLEKLINMNEKDFFAEAVPAEETLPNLGIAELGRWEAGLFINGVRLRADQYVIKEEPRMDYPYHVDQRMFSYKTYCSGRFLGVSEIEPEGKTLHGLKILAQEI